MKKNHFSFSRTNVIYSFLYLTVIKRLQASLMYFSYLQISKSQCTFYTLTFQVPHYSLYNGAKSGSDIIAAIIICFIISEDTDESPVLFIAGAKSKSFDPVIHSS